MQMLPVEGEAEEIIEAPIGRIRAGRAKRNGAAEVNSIFIAYISIFCLTF